MFTKIKEFLFGKDPGTHTHPRIYIQTRTLHPKP